MHLMENVGDARLICMQMFSMKSRSHYIYKFAIFTNKFNILII